MKLDLNFILNSVSGKPFEGKFDEIHAGAIVAGALAYNPAKLENLPPLKRFSIAQELYKTMPVELTQSELKEIKSLISQNNGFPPATISQVHEVIDKLLES